TARSRSEPVASAADLGPSPAGCIGRSPIEFGDRGGDSPLAGLADLGVDRQRDHLAARALGLREVALRVAEVREALLLVQRERVVDRVADLLRAQVLGERVAPLCAHGVLVV